MKLERFFEKFDQLADAPNAVAKMRELVLQLALNGSVIGLDSEKWERVPLGTLGDWGSGGTPFRSEPQYYGGSIPWLVIGDLNDGVVTSASTFITEEGLANSSARILPEGVLLIAMYGSIGKLGITGIECATNQAIAFCKPDPKRADLRYLFHTIKGIQPALLARGQGLAQKNISQTILKAWEITLPPLDEQKRIVAKVDEVMALCDRLEAQQQERDTRHAALARASLARFAEAPTPANLDFLFHDSYTITPADLRKSILTLAVHGKLVPQDQNDQPIRASLEEIRVKMVAATNSKSAAPRPIVEIDGAEVPYESPPGWMWIRLQDLLPEFQNGASSRGDKDGQEVIVLRLADITNRRVSLENTREILIASRDISKYSLQSGDILITRVNGSADIVGTFIQVDTDINAIYCDHFIRMRIDQACVNPSYMALLGDTRLIRDQIAGLFVSTAGQKTVNQTHIGSLLITLPPLPEQRRIVAKVDQLMALVDQLETQLTTSRTTAKKLMEAMVAELTTQD